jgi:hypothetical protein
MFAKNLDLRLLPGGFSYTFLIAQGISTEVTCPNAQDDMDDLP